MLIRSTFLLLLLATSCRVGVPIKSEPPRNNKTYTIEYLFEHDGCRVYRFQDGFNWVYFTNCTGSTFSRPDSSTVIQNTIIRKN
jgi:Domain of unknown function (DUF4884)